MATVRGLHHVGLLDAAQPVLRREYGRQLPRQHFRETVARVPELSIHGGLVHQQTEACISDHFPRMIETSLQPRSDSLGTLLRGHAGSFRLPARSSVRFRVIGGSPPILVQPAAIRQKMC